ncbi:MAG: hypothetical protein JSV86_03265 [Gemmatimonadota bacterium]|nr:MAG: hypothetical protein JSV86_03265 [Gemmatimonadota bacterium]
MIPYLGLTVLLSALISLPALHVLVDLFGALLGKEKSVSSSSVNGCNVWPWAVLVSTGVCFAAWGRFGYFGLSLAPVGTLLMSLLVALRLRFGDRAARRTEFLVDGAKITSTMDGRELYPQYLVDEVEYYCTGPASGYCVYYIELKGAHRTLAANGYLDEGRMRRDLRALIEDAGVKRLSLTFAADGSEGFRIANLGGELAGLILTRGSELPGEEYSWWQQFIRPGLDEGPVVQLEPSTVLDRLKGLATTFASDISRSGGLRHGIANLLAMAGEARSTIWAMPRDAFADFVDAHSDAQFTAAAPLLDRAADASESRQH